MFFCLCNGCRGGKSRRFLKYHIRKTSEGRLARGIRLVTISSCANTPPEDITSSGPPSSCLGTPTAESDSPAHLGNSMRKCRIHFFQCVGQWTPKVARVVEAIRELASLPCCQAGGRGEKKADHRTTRTHAVRQLPLSPVITEENRFFGVTISVSSQPYGKFEQQSFPTHRCDHGASKIKDSPSPARQTPARECPGWRRQVWV